MVVFRDTQAERSPGWQIEKCGIQTVEKLIKDIKGSWLKTRKFLQGNVSIEIRTSFNSL